MNIQKIISDPVGYVESKNTEYYGKKRSKRLRKKLRVGEYLELGLEVRAITHETTDSLFDGFYDNMVDQIIDECEDMGCHVGFFGASSVGKHSSPCKYDLCVVVEYDHNKVDTGDLIDMITHHFGFTERITEIDVIDVWR